MIVWILLLNGEAPWLVPQIPPSKDTQDDEYLFRPDSTWISWNHSWYKLHSGLYILSKFPTNVVLDPTHQNKFEKKTCIYINWNHSSKTIPYVAMPLGIILHFCISWRFGVGPPAVGNPYDGMQKLPGLLYARSFPSPGPFLLILHLKHCKYRQTQFLRGVILKISRIEPSDRFSCGTRWVQGVSLANNIHHPCPGTISASCSEISSSMLWR